MNRLYSIHLDGLNFDKDEILSFYSTVDQSQWKQRKDNLQTFWSIDENRSFDQNHPFFQKMVLKLNLPTRPHEFYFSRVFPGGLPNHSDFESFSKIQFPLPIENSAKWTDTKILFLDNYDNIIEEIAHINKNNELVPILYNCNQTHGTLRDISCKKNRITFVINCDLWFPRLKELYLQNRLYN